MGWRLIFLQEMCVCTGKKWTTEALADFVVCFETGSHCIAMIGFELLM